MQFFTIFLRFGPLFGTKIGEESALELEALEKRKTLQNTAWASKFQGSGFRKTMKNHLKNASEGDSEKEQPQNAKKTIFGAPGGRFGSPKRKIFGGFCEIFRSSFCDVMETAATQAGLAGLGGLRLSPWSLK